MAFLYHVKTCGYLPENKRTFDCYCKAISYIKEALSMAPKELGKEELELSIKLLRLDTDVDHRIASLFPEKTGNGVAYLQKTVK